MVTGVSSMRRHKMKPVITKTAEEPAEEASSTTPTAKEARIAERLMCPRAPRKQRSEKWIYSGGAVREYFAVPDLESVFVLRGTAETAN